LVEETRAAVESNVEETEKAIPHMTPLEEGELEELSCNHYPSSQELELEQFLCKPENLKTCPFHNQPLEQRESAKGWQFMRCLTQPCLISCGQDQVEPYMREVYKSVHIDIFGRWGDLLCFCGYLPALRQSQSTANPGRMYLSCRGKPYNRCKFFRWADLPVKPEDINDPISVREWLMDTAPAPPPPKYCDSLKDFHERQETVKIDVRDTNQVQHSEPWLSPIEPPPALQHWQKSFQDEETCVKPKRTDYELSDNVRKRYNKIGLF